MDNNNNINDNAEDAQNIDNVNNINEIINRNGDGGCEEDDIIQNSYLAQNYDPQFFIRNPASFDCIRKATIKKFKKYKVNTSKAGLFMQVMLKRTARKCNSWVMYYDIAVDPTLIPVDQPTTKKSSRQRTRSLDSVEVDVQAARKFHKRSFLKRSSSFVNRS
ncbi:hypothetical protein HELRODRAFT_171199 [Helobdella robusta]|uniref:Uncharacterized protein n=1 Tax=Helobdella robusta TaxID=6412 RepID=T1F3X6_HELRO|nr:hypothetical protein HELRODRAFT_171199 [Helobdella robusta]ESO05559.1 hypothetical protein HELRODRAFT_171199 [Helobdella robusta]